MPLLFPTISSPSRSAREAAIDLSCHARPSLFWWIIRSYLLASPTILEVVCKETTPGPTQCNKGSSLVGTVCLSYNAVEVFVLYRYLVAVISRCVPSVLLGNVMPISDYQVGSNRPSN